MHKIFTKFSQSEKNGLGNDAQAIEFKAEFGRTSQARTDDIYHVMIAALYA